MRQLRYLLATFRSKECVSVSSQTVERSFPSTLAGSCRNSAPDLPKRASGPPAFPPTPAPYVTLSPLAWPWPWLASLPPPTARVLPSLSRATTYMSSMTRFPDHSHSIPPFLLKPLSCSPRHQTDCLPLLLSQKLG